MSRSLFRKKEDWTFSSKEELGIRYGSIRNPNQEWTELLNWSKASFSFSLKPNEKQVISTQNGGKIKTQTPSGGKRKGAGGQPESKYKEKATGQPGNKDNKKAAAPVGNSNKLSRETKASKLYAQGIELERHSDIIEANSEHANAHDRLAMLLFIEFVRGHRAISCPR